MNIYRFNNPNIKLSTPDRPDLLGNHTLFLLGKDAADCHRFLTSWYGEPEPIINQWTDANGPAHEYDFQAQLDKNLYVSDDARRFRKFHFELQRRIQGVELTAAIFRASATPEKQKQYGDTAELVMEAQEGSRRRVFFTVTEAFNEDFFGDDEYDDLADTILKRF